MRSLLILYAWALRRNRGVLLALAILLFALEVLIVWAARVLDTGNAFPRIAGLVPAFVRESLGFDVTLLLRFEGALGIGYFHPAVLAALVASAVVALRGAVAEVEERTAELLIARPIPRWTILARSLALLLTCALGLPLVMLAGTALGLASTGVGRAVSLAPYLRLAGADACLAFGLGGVFAACAAAARRTRGYTQLAVGFALVAYVVEFLARVWPPIRPLGVLSPFHYVDSMAVLAGRECAGGLLVLIGLGVAASAWALFAFERRDL